MLKSFKIPVLSRKHQVVWGSFCIIISITLLFSFISFFSSWQYDQSNLEGIYVNEGEIKNIMQKKVNICIKKNMKIAIESFFAVLQQISV